MWGFATLADAPAGDIDSPLQDAVFPSLSRLPSSWHRAASGTLRTPGRRRGAGESASPPSASCRSLWRPKLFIHAGVAVVADLLFDRSARGAVRRGLFQNAVEDFAGSVGQLEGAQIHASQRFSVLRERRQGTQRESRRWLRLFARRHCTRFQRLRQVARHPTQRMETEIMRGRWKLPLLAQ